MTTTLITIVALYIALCVIAYLMQRQLIYHPFKQIVATPDEIGLAYSEFTLRSPDGTEFVVWEIPSPGSTIAAACFHGNADNISTNLETYQLLHDIGVGVFAVEYRGYLHSQGSPSEQGIAADLQTFADDLKNRLAGSNTKVVAIGRSLGGGVAAKFSGFYPVDGLILESTFNRMVDVGKRAFPFLPVSLLMREKYDSERTLAGVTCPKLVIHSRDDEVIPIDLGRKLYNSLTGEKIFVEISGSHNSAYATSGEVVRRAYAEFFAKLTK